MKPLWFFVAALAGCAEDPVSVARTNNPAVPVEFLFEHDGCKVYRFSDRGEKHYFVHCRDGSQSAQGTQSRSCGKGCVRSVEENIQTETSK